MSNTTSPPIWRSSSTTSRPASATTRTCSPLLARLLGAALAETADLRITEVLEKIDEVLAPHLYPPREDGSDPRVCPNCGKGRLNLKTARSGGAFIGCSNYPDCRYTRPFGARGPRASFPATASFSAMMTGDPIYLRTGRFGPYVQRGEATEETPKPPRASLPKGWTPDTMDLERALTLLNLPRPIGPTPRTASRSRPASAASAPTSSTAAPTPTCPRWTRSSPSA
jgi:DNA topoisomerase I